jgi:Rrf2 family protein
MLSKKAKYAIHALVYLAKTTTTEPILISKIAEEQRIPRKFLEAILLDLRNAGILGSKKGKGGGYYLLKKAEDINLAEVIRLFDGAIALLPCASYKYYEACQECTDEHTCGVRNAFLDIRNETVKLLKQSTIASIIEKEKKLAEQMQINKI